MSSLSPLAFGPLLRRHRMAAGVTQEALAESVSISRRSISDMERGVPHRPRKETVDLLAEVLGLSLEERSAFAHAAGQIRTLAHPRVSPDVRTTPPFVGRVNELALLERHLTGEGPAVLLFAGEPGIGKSRLLREGVERARAVGFTVLEGGCQGRGGHQPYAPLLAALQCCIRDRSVDRLGADLQGCTWLTRLLPELADGPIPPLPPWTLPPEQEHRLMVEAVIRFLTNVAGPAGTLLMLDDLQWADRDALDLLTALVRSAGNRPLRVVGAYRDTEVHTQDPLSSFLVDLAPSGFITRRALDLLAPHEAAQLFDALVEGADSGLSARREQVLQRAGGVPFFLVSCAQGVRLGETGGEAVPWDVAQSVRQRVAALPATAQEVLQLAAVVGREVPCALLVVAAPLSEEEVLACFDAACQARLLEEIEEDAYRFVHDVIREVMEADLGAARRKVVHRRLAEVLERKPGERPVELLAYHYARSDTAEKAALYLEQAGDKAQARFAHASAVDCYRKAVTLLDELGRTHDAARAREKLGMALRLAAQYDAALPALEQAAVSFQLLGDVEGERRNLAQIGWVHALRGTPDEGIDRIQPVLEKLDRSIPSTSLAALYVALGRLWSVSGRQSEELAATERAVEAARLAGDIRLLAAAQAARSGTLVMFERFDEAQQAGEEAARLAEDAGELAALFFALIHTSGAHCYRGELIPARRLDDRAVQIAEQTSDVWEVMVARSSRGMRAICTGEWGLAQADGEAAVSLCRQIGPSEATGFALLQHGRLCLFQGDWDRAVRELEESVALFERCRHLTHLCWAQSALAELDLLLGRPEKACRRLVSFLDDLGPMERMTVYVRPTLAWAYLEAGDLVKAEEVLRLTLSRARSTGNRLGLVEALRVQAMLTTRQGRWAQAEQALEEGMLLTQRMPYPYAEARLLQVFGQMQLKRGEPELARERLEAGMDIFQRLGARKDAERVQRVLAELAPA